ncbi:DUF429 domain-containing protein [Microcoleus sp. FACHB-831]|uniref:DUF429 domain-containing protein n=1 Tax=Microcoleus sp. FACHB-831 TaxID=2692827 RepID=UPI0016839557|nr:DUF429 domain-containing protein [Microcoleus sp. FACHB-831]MBD1923048.1 DUF429 domain-containing protein [Microcoleus sp. FACHB-831]
MKFIGIDLGWRSQPSGCCCLSPQDGKLQIVDLTRIDAIADILDWIDTTAPPTEPAIIAVDAPTLIPNATGMRLPDKLAHKHFGKYHAGCYPANLGLPFAQRTVEFGLQLETRGFVHAPIIEPQKRDRYQIEVFPHPAIVNLFGLERILKYKKGKLAERQLELIKLYQYIVNILPNLQPSLKPDFRFSILDFGLGVAGENIECSKIPNQPLIENPKSKIQNYLTGAALKALEDQLDSLICAYVAAHWWYWGLERNLVLGDRTTGYIVIPNRF